MSATFLILVIVGAVALLIYGYNIAEPYKPGEVRTTQEAPGARMICPHCQVRGQVRTRSVRLKRGISGGKATAALLTGGISILATGLAKKEDATEAECHNCGAIWHF